MPTAMWTRGIREGVWWLRGERGQLAVGRWQGSLPKERRNVGTSDLLRGRYAGRGSEGSAVGGWPLAGEPPQGPKERWNLGPPRGRFAGRGSEGAAVGSWPLAGEPSQGPKERWNLGPPSGALRGARERGGCSWRLAVGRGAPKDPRTFSQRWRRAAPTRYSFPQPRRGDLSIERGRTERIKPQRGDMLCS